MAVKITGADRGTPAEQAGLAGATLLSIDGNEINDMLDYEFFSSCLLYTSPSPRD